MGKKEEFKDFVRIHPELISYVENDTMTWQKFYDIFDLYGTDNSVWNKYFENNKDSNLNNVTSWTDIINMVRNIDVDKVQSGITSLQKALGLVSDLFVKDNSSDGDDYTPRPLYRSFED